MAFDLAKLPAPVQLAFRTSAPSFWNAVVFGAIACGVRDPKVLADLAFHLHHPELSGQSIRPDQSDLISEWKSYYHVIRKALSKPGNASGGVDISEEESKRAKILHALDGFRLNQFIESTEEGKDFQVMIDIAKFYLKGKSIDPKYWHFTAMDSNGHVNIRGDNPHFLKRGAYSNVFHHIEPSYVVDYTPDSIGRALYGNYKIMERHTNLLFKWHRLHAGTADAKSDDRIEMRYIKDVVQKICQSNPVSVYYTFRKRFRQFDVALPAFTLAPYYIDD